MNVQLQEPLPDQALPAWYREFTALFGAGAGHGFIFCRDVHGVTSIEGASQLGFMQAILHTDRRDIIVYYHRAVGIQFPLPSIRTAALDLLGPDWTLPSSSEDLLAALDASGVVSSTDQSQTDVFSSARTPRQALAVMEALIRSPLAIGRVALIIDGADLIWPATSKATMRDDQLDLLAKILYWGNDSTLGSQNNPVVLLSPHLSDLHPDLRSSDSGYKLIELALPDEQTRLSYLTWYLDVHRREQPIALLDLGKEDLARNTAGLNLRQVEDILLLGARPSSSSEPVGVTRRLVKARKDAIIRQQYSDVIEMLDPLPDGFEGLGGMEELINFTRMEVLAPLRAGRLQDVPKGILLVGPPGMGKTRYVEAAAKELGFNAIALRMSKILGGIVGTSERNLQEVFDVARGLEPTIIFMDELDTILANQRGQNSGSPVAANLFGAILVFLGDESIRGRVLVVGATNHPEWLDPALKRFGRFDVTYPVLSPEVSGRRSMLQVQARLQATTIEASALTLIANETDHYSAADLEAVVKEARYLSGLAGRASIGLQEAREALENIRPSTLSSVGVFTQHALDACNNLRYLPPPVAAQERQRRRLAAGRKEAEVSAAPLLTHARSAREI